MIRSVGPMIVDGLNLLGSVSVLAAIVLSVVATIAAIANRVGLPAWFEHWCWRLAFIKILLVLVITQPIAIPLLPAKPVERTNPVLETSSLQLAIEPEWDNVTGQSENPLVAVAVRAGNGLVTETDQRVLAKTDHSSLSTIKWLMCLAGLWLCGALLNAVLLLMQWLRVWRLPLCPITEPKFLDACRRRSLLMGVRVPDLAVCDVIPSPSLVGFFRPKIVLPTETMAQCGDAEFDAILSHELAHLRRRDLWWSLLPGLIQVLFFFHPWVWLAQRRWLLSREKACDAEAIDRLDGSVSQYADSLLRIAELVSHRVQSQRLLGCVSVFHSSSALKKRLVAMKNYEKISLTKSFILASCLGVVAAFGVIPWTLVNRASAADEERTEKGPASFGKNMNFEEKSRTGLAKDWSGGNKGYVISLDDQNPHSGTSCGKISSNLNTERFGTFLQSIKPDGLRGKRIEYTGYLRTNVEGEGAGQLWMRIDADRKPVGFDNMSDRQVQGKTDWKQYKIVLDVPPEATLITFGLMMSGKGSVWADDLELKVVDGEGAIPKLTTTHVLLRTDFRNPDFEQAVTNRPAQAKHWGGGGKGFELVRDTAVKHSGMASGRIRQLSSESYFGTFTTGLSPKNYKSARVRYSGFLKTEDADSAGLWMRVDGVEQFVLAFDNMDGRRVTGTKDWKKYELVLDVPTDATAIAFGFLLVGKGTVWADDLKIESVDAEVESTDMKINRVNANRYRNRPKDFANGDFEEVAEDDHPKHWARGGKGFKLSRDENVKYTGTASGKITRTDPTGKSATLGQMFPATKYLGKRIRFRGYLKTENANSVGLLVRVDGQKNGRVIRGYEVPELLGFDNMSSRRVTGTTNWSSYEVILDVPDDATFLYLGFLSSGEGTAWADELSLEVVGALGEGPPVTGRPEYATGQ